MDPPQAAEVETKSEKTEKAKSYDCGLCDTEVVYRIAQELMPGLASSCVDNTTGGLFTSAGTIVVAMRKEMTDYLTKRSETYVAEYLLTENASMLELSEHPYDIVMNIIDDFASSKTNMLSRVSEWVLTDRREDRIDDFVQEMEINGFWLLAPRESVASMLLKNVDYKNSFHCNVVCNSEEEVVKHRSECMFRPMDCTNEGCTTRYCVAQKEHHEAVCPFMVLPCEQKCSDSVTRREMDRHCVTICPMKLVHCAFNTVGCTSSIPQCNVQQHNVDDLSSHLLYIIKTAYKGASDEDLKHRVEQIRNLSNIDRLARARDTRALTYLIKDVEAKLGPLDVKTKSHEKINKKESPKKTKPSVVKDSVDAPKKSEEHQGSQPAIEMVSSTEKPVITKDEATKLSTKSEPSVVKDVVDPPKKTEEHKGSQSANETRPSNEKPVKTEDDAKLSAKSKPSVVKDGVDPPKMKEENQGSKSATETMSSTEKPIKTDNDTKLPTKSEQSVVKDGVDPPKKKEEHKESQSAIETISSTEKPVKTENDNTKLPTKEVHPESSTSTDPTVKIEGNKDKDKDGSSTSLMKNEHNKDLAAKEHTRSPEGEKVKDESSNIVEKAKELSISDVEQTKKSLNVEDTKTSPGKETIKDSSKSDEQESKKSTTKETVIEPSHQALEKVNVSPDSDDESMKSPLEEAEEAMKTPPEDEEEELMKSPLEEPDHAS